MTIRTAILEARFLLGERKLFDELMTASTRKSCRTQPPNSSPPSLPNARSAIAAPANRANLVEPNVKDGKGGLRDLHTLYWIAKYVYRVQEREELIAHGVYDQREYTRFAAAAISYGRCAWPRSFRNTGVPRPAVVRHPARDRGAARLHQHPACATVERFMKHYFLVAKDVGDLTAILCAELEDKQTKAMPVLSRMMAKFRPRAQQALSETDDFIVDYNRITVASRSPMPSGAIRSSDPHLLAGAEVQSRLSSRRVTRDHAFAQSDRPQSAPQRGGNRLFLEILTSNNDAETVLRRMNEAGGARPLRRSFGRIVAMMQFNMYHHYTVDEHLLRCIGILHDIDAGRSEDTKFATELMRTMQPQSRLLLYVALFLHDIGQGAPGRPFDRRRARRASALSAARLLSRWTIRSPGVEQHLVMSTVAQSRDLSVALRSNFSDVAQSVSG